MKQHLAEKDEARRAAWDRLQAEKLARFPFPPHGRIPNFAGAAAAAERLFEVEPWRSARCIKVHPTRRNARCARRPLRRGITVLVPTPRLRAGSRRLDPARIGQDQIEAAASLSKGDRFVEEVPLGARPTIDAIVCGPVAVTAMAGAAVRAKVIGTSSTRSCASSATRRCPWPTRCTPYRSSADCRARRAACRLR